MKTGDCFSLLFYRIEKEQDMKRELSTCASPINKLLPQRSHSNLTGLSNIPGTANSKLIMYSWTHYFFSYKLLICSKQIFEHICKGQRRNKPYCQDDVEANKTVGVEF